MRNYLSILVIITVTLLSNSYASAGQKTAPIKDIVKDKKIYIKSQSWFEDCNKWEAGDTVNVKFSSSKPVGFSAHYRDRSCMENIVVLEKPSIDSYEGSINVQTGEVYCIMWHNKNLENITVKYDIGVKGM